MTISPDLANALFEVIGGLFILLSVRKLHRDKEVKGVHWAPVTFFTSWGVWNLYFYPAVGQWLSFWGGLSVCSVNFIWLSQILYYGYRRKP